MPRWLKHLLLAGMITYVLHWVVKAMLLYMFLSIWMDAFNHG